MVWLALIRDILKSQGVAALLTASQSPSRMAQLAGDHRSQRRTPWSVYGLWLTERARPEDGYRQNTFAPGSPVRESTALVTPPASERKTG